MGIPLQQINSFLRFTSNLFFFFLRVQLDKHKIKFSSVKSGYIYATVQTHTAGTLSKTPCLTGVFGLLVVSAFLGQLHYLVSLFPCLSSHSSLYFSYAQTFSNLMQLKCASLSFLQKCMFLTYFLSARDFKTIFLIAQDRA